MVFVHSSSSGILWNNYHICIQSKTRNICRTIKHEPLSSKPRHLIWNMNGWVGVISSWLKQLPGQEVQYFPIHGCRNWQLGKKHEPNICRDLYKFLKDNIPLGILKHPGPQSWQWKMLLFLMRNRSRFLWIEKKTFWNDINRYVCHVRQPEGTSTDHYLSYSHPWGTTQSSRHPRGIASLHQQIFAEDGLHTHTGCGGPNSFNH